MKKKRPRKKVKPQNMKQLMDAKRQKTRKRENTLPKGQKVKLKRRRNKTNNWKTVQWTIGCWRQTTVTSLKRTAERYSHWVPMLLTINNMKMQNVLLLATEYIWDPVNVLPTNAQCKSLGSAPKFFRFHAGFLENLVKLYVRPPLGYWCPLLRRILDPPLFLSLSQCLSWARLVWRGFRSVDQIKYTNWKEKTWRLIRTSYQESIHKYQDSIHKYQESIHDSQWASALTCNVTTVMSSVFYIVLLILIRL